MKIRKLLSKHLWATLNGGLNIDQQPNCLHCVAYWWQFNHL